MGHEANMISEQMAPNDPLTAPDVGVVGLFQKQHQCVKGCQHYRRHGRREQRR